MFQNLEAPLSSDFFLLGEQGILQNNLFNPVAPDTDEMVMMAILADLVSFFPSAKRYFANDPLFF
jgi:hypothetical protein